MTDVLYTLAWALGTLGALALVIALGRHLKARTQRMTQYARNELEQSRNQWLISGLVLLVLVGSLIIAAATA